MDEGHEMYEMQFPAPDVGPKNGGLTMVVALQGYADAGLAVAGSASHLIDALDHRPLVNFNNDELVDYRSRRPAVTMVGDAVADSAELELSLQVVRPRRLSSSSMRRLAAPGTDTRWPHVRWPASISRSLPWAMMPSGRVCGTVIGAEYSETVRRTSKRSTRSATA